VVLAIGALPICVCAANSGCDELAMKDPSAPYTTAFLKVWRNVFPVLLMVLLLDTSQYMIPWT
jgi:hypothetical protein